MKRCHLCILPDSFPNIRFNEDGICNHCRESHDISYKGKDTLEKILEPYKDNKKKYNCIVPLSGGKDSSIVLYNAVKVFGLKPIAVNYDSGFQSAVARENMENICSILNVPLYVKKAGKISRMILREALLISETVGSFFGICGNCESILRSISINLAKRKNISLILWGASSIENVEDEYVDKSNAVGMKGFIKNLKNVKKLLKTFPHLINYYCFSVIQRIQMGIPVKYIFNIRSTVPFTENKINVLYFFDYIAFDPIKIIKTLKKEVKWVHPENRESRFDCLLHPFINHHNLQLLGISSDGYVYSNMIRSGAINREEALLKETNIEKTVEKECKNIIDELGFKNYKMPDDHTD